MLDALERIFETIRFVVLDALRVGGPLAIPLILIAALFLMIVFRDRVVSIAGLIAVLAIAALAVTIRAVQLGRL
jgi:hypothetical protein